MELPLLLFLFSWRFENVYWLFFFTFPFFFNNVTCWTCIKRIPFRAKIMYIAHNSVSMACDRNMCILVMVWSQYHSPSKDAVLLLPNACCPSLFSVFSELMMGERLKVNDMKIIKLIIKQKHLVLKLVNHWTFPYLNIENGEEEGWTGSNI